jgi:hypothetical protein
VVAFLVPFVCALPTFPNFLLNYGEWSGQTQQAIWRTDPA